MDYAAQAASVSSVEDTKTALYEALEGTDRGIYGVPVRHMCVDGMCRPDRSQALQCPTQTAAR